MKRADDLYLEGMSKNPNHTEIEREEVGLAVAELKALREVEAAARTHVDLMSGDGEAFWITRAELKRKLKVLDSE